MQETFLILTRQGDSHGSVTVGKRHDQGMDIHKFSILYSFHRPKIDLCFTWWMFQPFVTFIRTVCTVVVLPLINEVTDRPIRTWEAMGFQLFKYLLLIAAQLSFQSPVFK